MTIGGIASDVTGQPVTQELPVVGLRKLHSVDP
jgi:hypothetical protein